METIKSTVEGYSVEFKHLKVPAEGTKHDFILRISDEDTVYYGEFKMDQIKAPEVIKSNYDLFLKIMTRFVNNDNDDIFIEKLNDKITLEISVKLYFDLVETIIIELDKVVKETTIESLSDEIADLKKTVKLLKKDNDCLKDIISNVENKLLEPKLYTPLNNTVIINSHMLIASSDIGNFKEFITKMHEYTEFIKTKINAEQDACIIEFLKTRGKQNNFLEHVSGDNVSIFPIYLNYLSQCGQHLKKLTITDNGSHIFNIIGLQLHIDKNQQYLYSISKNRDYTMFAEYDTYNVNTKECVKKEIYCKQINLF
jgi:hypothetical protein